MAVKHHTPSSTTEDVRSFRVRSSRLSIGNWILGVLAALAMLVSIWMIFFYAPRDSWQGDAQRIFYFHVPSAWVGMLSFVVLAIAGIIYLFKSDILFDLIARTAAEVGCVFLGIALITGSIWAKTAWGAWWVWDPKLTATLILWFMFVGYLMLRSYMGDGRDSARAGAIWGIVGVFDVPLIYLSVEWWRGQHPGPQVATEGGLPGEALLTLLVCVIAFTLLYGFLMGLVYRLNRLQLMARRLRAMVE